jgi:hypothetical protein
MRLMGRNQGSQLVRRESSRENGHDACTLNPAEAATIRLAPSFKPRQQEAITWPDTFWDRFNTASSHYHQAHYQKAKEAYIAARSLLSGYAALDVALLRTYRKLYKAAIDKQRWGEAHRELCELFKTLPADVSDTDRKQFNKVLEVLKKTDADFSGQPLPLQKQAVMELIPADAERRDPQHRKALVVLLDGALGLWNLATKLFKPWKHVTFVLDIMHVVGYLWSAANALFEEPSKAGNHWVQQKLTERLRGRVGYVISGLRQILTKQRLRRSVRETLAKVITFFHNHRRWMPYDAYVAIGLPVGTGVVESACGSVVKHRMEGEGKRGSLAGAEATLTWRSLKKSPDHDLRAYWRFRARQERVRLDARKPTYRPTPRLRRVA